MAEGRMKQRCRAHAQRGAALLESILTLGVASIATLTIIGFVQEATNHVKQQVAAQQLRAVYQALKGYATQNGTGLGDNAPTTISIATLKSGFYLPPWFTELNVYGQSYRIGLRKDTTKATDGVFGFVGFAQPGGANGGDCTRPPARFGSDKVDEKKVRQIATMVGSDGGFVRDTARPKMASEDSTVPDPVPVGFGEGAFGSWRAAIDIPNSGIFTGSLQEGSNPPVSGFSADTDMPQAGCMMALLFVSP